MPWSRWTSARSRSCGGQRGSAVSGGTLSSTDTPRPASVACGAADHLAQHPLEGARPAAAAAAAGATGVGAEPSADGPAERLTAPAQAGRLVPGSPGWRRRASRARPRGR